MSLLKAVSSEKAHADPEVVSVIQEDVYRPEVDTSGVNERKLMWKIDWHTVPWLAFLYFLNSLDRGNIGNAKVSRPPRCDPAADIRHAVVWIGERVAHHGRAVPNCSDSFLLSLRVVRATQ